MTTISGKTSNGCTYEGTYDAVGHGRVDWTVTFRRDGDFAGIRHGRILDASPAPSTDLVEAVRADIEFTWTGVH